MKQSHLCDSETSVRTKFQSETVQIATWGEGHELRISEGRSAFHAQESWYFDPEGYLVGTVFTFPKGLPLDDYPVLRETLSSLRSARDFYLNVAQLPTKSRMDTTRLFQTGEEKTTHQYLVTGTQNRPILLMATFTIDPYVSLFSPYRKEFLDALRGPDSVKTSQGAVDQLPYSALLHFARGETALLSYCGARNPQVAIDGYQKSIADGLGKDTVRLAEAHHKLGLAWEASGNLEKAKTEMEQSLVVRPNIPEVINNLGTTYLRLGDRDRAIQLFERAVSLRPNYPLARFNFAEAIEPTNRRLAVSEYETYLALVEGIPEEASRSELAKKRIKDLKR